MAFEKPILRVQQESAKALGAPVLEERLLSQGAIPSGMAPTEIAAYIAAETQKWAQVVSTQGPRWVEATWPLSRFI